MSKKFYVDNLTVDQILNMDPAQMAKLDKRDVSRALRTVALAANKRIQRLEQYAKRTKTGYVQKATAGKAIATDALNWVSGDGARKAKFGVRKTSSRNQMLQQIGQIRKFMQMKTSTVTGAVSVRKAREKNIFGKTREQAGKGKTKKEKKSISRSFRQNYSNIWSAYHKYRELRHEDPHALYDDSNSVLNSLGSFIMDGTDPETAVQSTFNKMQQEIADREIEYSDLFGDDFNNFGTFNV